MTIRDGNRQVRDVEFDVAVTSETSKEGGGKIKVLEIGLGGEVSKTDSNVSRVHFVVGVALPPSPPETERLRPDIVVGEN